jgi:hypothetical protein
MALRQCSKCQLYKDAQEFGWRPEGQHVKSWCYACQEASSKNWREKNEERVKRNKRAQYLKRRDLKHRTVTAQCEICGLWFVPEAQEGSKHPASPHWDHDHGSEKFRGWLCHNHNAMLGHAGDNPEILELGAKYLREHGCTPTQKVLAKLQT